MKYESVYHWLILMSSIHKTFKRNKNKSPRNSVAVNNWLFFTFNFLWSHYQQEKCVAYQQDKSQCECDTQNILLASPSPPALHNFTRPKEKNDTDSSLTCAPPRHVRVDRSKHFPKASDRPITLPLSGELLTIEATDSVLCRPDWRQENPDLGPEGLKRKRVDETAANLFLK